MQISKEQLLTSFDSGVIRYPKLYINLFGKIPNDYIVQINSDTPFDLSKFDFSKVKEIFPDCILVNNTIIDESIISSVEQKPQKVFYSEVENQVYTDKIIIICDIGIFILTNDTIALYNNVNNPEKYVKQVRDILPLQNTVAKEANVQLVVYNQEYYTVDAAIEPQSINLEENYNDDFIPIYKDIEKFLTDRKSGLIVLRGEVGTGKTNLIRHLTTSFPTKYTLITTSVAEHLASPEFMSFMLEHKDNVFILEDCEQILVDRTDGNYSNAISNILNISDGLMSDVFNIKFICTFNADISKIDKALLRKGRCFVNYEFKPLEAEKAKVLLNRQNIYLDEYRPMTLSEIYNYQDTDCKGEETKIGF